MSGGLSTNGRPHTEIAPHFVEAGSERALPSPAHVSGGLSTAHVGTRLPNVADPPHADPVEAMIPTAAALAIAVADFDAPQVEHLLLPMGVPALLTLAVTLAAHVDLDRPMTSDLPTPLTPESTVTRAVNIAAEMFGTDPGLILSEHRGRPATDARAVAMAACRLVGLTSVYIGVKFDRDHTTVLYACGRVGEDARLRALSRRVAIQCGWDRNRDDEDAA